MKFLDPEWHDKLSSTNTVLLEWLNDGVVLSPGFVLAAVEQTAGHGRYNRQWVSQAGQDLTFSFLLHTKHDISGIASLPMAIALGTASAFDTFGMATKTKWPNDLLVRGMKIAGILCQKSNVKGSLENAIVVGMGINVNMQKSNAAPMGKPITSLRVETGKMYPIKEVLGIILEILPHWIDRWEKGGFASIREDWIARCLNVGKQITVAEGKDLISGVLEGFGNKGQILLRSDDGKIRDIWVGDIE